MRLPNPPRGGRFSALFLGSILLAPACGPAQPEVAAPVARAPTHEPEQPARPEPLTAAETELAAELRRHVAELAGKIGERNPKKPWGLADATDYITVRLEEMGYEVGRQGIEVDETLAQNVDVTIPGGERGREIVLVGAHYDSAPGCPGADDNASGTAALLALARRLRDFRSSRTLRLAFFVNEEPPYFQTKQMGSFVYAARAAQQGDAIVAMLSLESLGYFTDEPDSQHYPKEIAAAYPTTGNFLAFVSEPRTQRLLDASLVSFRRHSKLPAEGATLPRDAPGVGWSDHWSFWQFDFAGLMITDTAPYRNPNYHKPTDKPDTLDYQRFTRAVAGIESVVRDLAGERADAKPPKDG